MERARRPVVMERTPLSVTAWRQGLGSGAGVRGESFLTGGGLVCFLTGTAGGALT